MEFEPIRIDELNIDGIKRIPEDDEVLTVSYLLSGVGEPPEEWEKFFKESLKSSAYTHRYPDALTLGVNLKPYENIKIAGKQITFKCRVSEENAKKIKKGGPFWSFVEDHVAYANEEYRKFLEKGIQEEAEARKKQEQKDNEYKKFIQILRKG